MRYQNPHLNQGQVQQFPQQMRPNMQQFPQQMHPGMQQFPQQMHPTMQQFPQQMHPGMQQFPQQMHPGMQQFPQQMHLGMQQQYPPQFQQQFGNNQASVPVDRFTQPAHQSNKPQEGIRYEEEEETVDQAPQEFIVSQMDIRVPYAKSLNKKVHINKVTDMDIHLLDGVVSADCLQEVVETIFDVTHEKSLDCLLIHGEFIVNKTVYNDDIVEHVQDLFLLNIKDLYKQLKRFYIDLNSLSDLVVLETVNKTLTDRLNEFVGSRLSTNISIDSFAHDFNDLLKFVRTNYEDREDELISYMDNVVDEIAAIIKALKDENTHTLPEIISLVKVNLHSLELGIRQLTKDIVKVKESVPNNFILTAARLLKQTTTKDNFTFVTIDKTLIRVIVNEDNEVFMKLV